jgi:SAM-dependent methyltransferase
VGPRFEPMAESPAPSFGAVAATYARYRPGYPATAVDWALAPLAERPEPDLLDLGAGTGKLTEALMGRGRLTAQDPDPAMLAQLRAHHPSIDVREGSAEQIPLPDASVDAVLVGQAFHWFDRDRAMPEIARVLRPGGVLAALWIGSDVRVDWVRGFHEAGSWDPDAQFHDDAKHFPDGYGVASAEFATFPFASPTTLDGLIAEISTHSWVLTTEPAARGSALARARAYLAERPETSGGEFELPRIADVLRARRLADWP